MELINELLTELIDELIDELPTELIDELLLELLDNITLEFIDDGDGFDGEFDPPPPHPTITPPDIARHKYRLIFVRIIKHHSLLVIRKRLSAMNT